MAPKITPKYPGWEKMMAWGRGQVSPTLCCNKERNAPTPRRKKKGNTHPLSTLHILFPRRGGLTPLIRELGRKNWVGERGIPLLPTFRSACPQRMCVLLNSCVPRLGSGAGESLRLPAGGRSEAHLLHSPPAGSAGLAVILLTAGRVRACYAEEFQEA